MRLIVCLILFSSIGFAQQEQRFQIVEVDNVLRENEQSQNRLILKIDTHTGNVWYLQYVIRDLYGHTVMRPEWSPIADPEDGPRVFLDSLNAEKKPLPVFDFSDIDSALVKKKK